MKILIVISVFLSVIVKSQSLDAEITEKLVIDDTFNTWSQTFSNLNLSNFKEAESHIFNETDFFNSQKEYPSYIQELFSFSPNKKMYVYLYDDMGIIKKGNQYYSDPGSGYQAYLNLYPTEQNLIIYKGGDISGISENIWIGNKIIALLGTEMDFDSGETKPIIVVVNLEEFTSKKYTTKNKETKFLSRYESPKISKLKLKFLE